MRHRTKLAPHPVSPRRHCNQPLANKGTSQRSSSGPSSQLNWSFRNIPLDAHHPQISVPELARNDMVPAFAQSVDPRLPPYTPAWTENGQIRLSPYSLLLPPSEIASVLQHEKVHAVHQRIAPRTESISAHSYAESIAARDLGSLSIRRLRPSRSQPAGLPAPDLRALDERHHRTPRSCRGGSRIRRDRANF